MEPSWTFAARTCEVKGAADTLKAEADMNEATKENFMIILMEDIYEKNESGFIYGF